MYDDYGWAPYVPVGQRILNAKRMMQQRTKQGHPVDPVCIEGRAIARTPWGKAWCTNLESYSDFANRLPRGRRYARNGSLVDLQLKPGLIEAYVAGSDTYQVTIAVGSVPRKQWQAMCADCSGSIDSLLGLLRGKLDKAIMQRLCRQGDGLFPPPKHLHFSCTCPDGASMCKHVAAALYGVGNRLDAKPELLFTLRDVDPEELIASAAVDGLADDAQSDDTVLASDELGDIFGLDLDDVAPTPEPRPRKRAPARPRMKASAKPREKATTQPSGRTLYARLYRHLSKAGSLTSSEAQQKLKKDAATLRPLFKQLVSEGHASVTGKARGTTYHMVTS